MLGVDKYSIIRIPCATISSLNQLDHTWYHTIDYLLKKKIDIRVYNFKYIVILGEYNYWVIIIILDDGIDDDDYENS